MTENTGYNDETMSEEVASNPYPTHIPSTDHPLPDDAANPDEETIGASQSLSNEANNRYIH